MKKLVSLLPLALLAAGCSGGEDPGNVETAAKAAAAMPKTAADLPADMPPMARKQAEGAMAQGAAQRAMMEKQGAAMKAARGGQ